MTDPGLLIEESDAVSLAGTPGYVPPERFTNAASDIYSLGLTLKAANFGRQVDELYKGPTMEADTGNARFPARWRILNKATDPVASRRYRSAKALAKDLQALRLKMPLAAKTRNLPRYARLLIGVLAAVLAASAFRVKMGLDEHSAKESEQTEADIAIISGEMNETLLRLRAMHDITNLVAGTAEE